MQALPPCGTGFKAGKAGAPHPDISTKDAFINTLLNAKSLSYSLNGASGLYLKDLLVQLGVAEQVNAREIILDKGFTAELAATGQVDLALQQISELMSVSGIELVGRLPVAFSYRPSLPLAYSRSRPGAMTPISLFNSVVHRAPGRYSNIADLNPYKSHSRL